MKERLKRWWIRTFINADYNPEKGYVKVYNKKVLKSRIAHFSWAFAVRVPELGGDIKIVTGPIFRAKNYKLGVGAFSKCFRVGFVTIRFWGAVRNNDWWDITDDEHVKYRGRAQLSLIFLSPWFKVMLSNVKYYCRLYRYRKRGILALRRMFIHQGHLDINSAYIPDEF